MGLMYDCFHSVVHNRVEKNSRYVLAFNQNVGNLCMGVFLCLQVWRFETTASETSLL